MAQNGEELPVMERFKASLESFQNNVKQVTSIKNVPVWFKDFSSHLDVFSNDVVTTIMQLESDQCQLKGELAIQKAVTNALDKERKNLQDQVTRLETELEDLQQYTRRTNVLIHGLEEEPNEDTDKKVLDILKSKLDLPLSLNDFGRSHRLGKLRHGAKRPIIVRFASYRQRKMTFDAKRKLKGSRIVITENLTKERYSLYKQCIVKFGRESCWTLDGRIYCLTGKKDSQGRNERIVLTKQEDLDTYHV